MLKDIKNAVKEVTGAVGAVFGGALLLGVCNVVTPLAMMGLPRIQNILGLKIKDVRVEHFEADEDEDSELRVPELLDIKFDGTRLTINLEDNTLMSTSSKEMSPATFGFDSNGSGGIGVMLLGLPGSIVCLPAIVVFNAIWWGFYKLTGMQHDYYLFFRRIKNELDVDTRFILKEALLKSSRNHREYSVEVLNS